MSTDKYIAIGEMRLDPRSKLFPRTLKAKFDIERKRKLALGKYITISNSELKPSGNSRKKGQWHVIYLTDEQYAVALQKRDSGKSFKLSFSPLQREYNARYASGFFGDLWDGVKSAASTVYNGVKKAANSKIGKAILKGVDVGVSVLSEGAIPVGLTSGVVGAVFADDPEPEPEPEQDLEGDVPDEDYTPLPQIHPKTGQQYSFPSPPTRPNGQAYTNANPPPIPKLPPPSKKVSKHPPLPALPAPILGSNAPIAPAYAAGLRRRKRGGNIYEDFSRKYGAIAAPRGGMIHNSQAVILSSRPRIGVPKMVPHATTSLTSEARKGEGINLPRVYSGGALPKIVQTKNGARYHDGRKFVSKATYDSLVGSKGKGINMPRVQAF